MGSIIGAAILIVYFEFFVWRPYKQKKEYTDFCEKTERRMWNMMQFLTPEEIKRYGWDKYETMDKAVAEEYRRNNHL